MSTMTFGMYGLGSKGACSSAETKNKKRAEEPELETAQKPAVKVLLLTSPLRNLRMNEEHTSWIGPEREKVAYSSNGKS